jgi:hypothetical protein
VANFPFFFGEKYYEKIFLKNKKIKKKRKKKFPAKNHQFCAIKIDFFVGIKPTFFWSW